MGDGRLPHPGADAIGEIHYDWAPVKAFAVSLDYQLVDQPGYSRDRGPANVFAVRLHGQVSAWDDALAPIALTLDPHLDATVFLLTFGGRVVGDGQCGAESLDDPRRQTPGGERVADIARAVHRKLLV